jgi:hypothetical protein
MRRVALGVVVLLVVGLAASKALAAGPNNGPHAKANIQLVGHPGPHGYHHPGWYRPRVYGPPAVAVPVRPTYYGYPYYGYPGYYGYPAYYYRPGTTFSYYGPGGGISVGW